MNYFFLSLRSIMTSTNVLIMFIIFLLIHHTLAGVNIRTPKFGVLNFKKMNGHYLNVSRGVSTEVAHIPECANNCRKNKTCSTFNVEKNGEKTYCELLQDDYCSNQDKVVVNTKRQIFYLQLECCSKGCLNGGKCLMSNNKARQFCSCPHPYGGERCEVPDKQYCNIFSEEDQLGTTKYIDEATQSLLNSDGENLNDKTKSLRLFGIWILYKDDFSYYSDNLLLESEREKFINLEGPLYGTMSAIRPVGPLIDPFHKEWLVLYSRPQYFGDEILIENDVSLPSVLWNDDAESMIMYGTSSWTLFDTDSYAARSVCLKGRSDGKRKQYWTLTTFNLANQVSSVKKGCHSSTIA